jgi:hypothetical protein
MSNQHSRRSFLQYSSAGLAATKAAAKTTGLNELPSVDFDGAEVSKLIIGSNPLYGYSHFNPLYSKLMREWMTEDKRIELLHRCEKAGIRTWQVHYSEQTLKDLRRYRDEGGRMNLLLLGMGDMMRDYGLIKKFADEQSPLGIAHHGNQSDDLIRAGKKQKVKDWCKAARDAGVAVGVSCHNPDVVALVEDEDWDIDYYMTCMYRVTRRPSEVRAELGEAPLGEIYMERDPERMLKMVQETEKTCFAFKVLGAGRQIARPAQLDAALRFVLERIKPQDAMIVGMFHRFKDEVADNVARVKRVLGKISTS